MFYARTLVDGLRDRLGDEHGQDLIEYALLGGVIAVALAALITAGALTGALTSMADGISDCIDFSSAVGSECP
jgi:Flp pilus assembly pilin Flp